MRKMYTVTRIDYTMPEDFSTMLFMDADAARQYAHEVAGLQADQIIIGETHAYAGETWYDSVEKAEEDNTDGLDAILQINMHVLPDVFHGGGA